MVDLPRSPYESPLQELGRYKYSPAYSRVRTPANTAQPAIPRHYLTDKFETTAHEYGESNVYEDLDKFQRSTLKDWSTDKPLFEQDMPRNHAHFGAGLLQLRYNGARGEEYRPDHGEMFLGDMSGHDSGRIDYRGSRLGYQDDIARMKRRINREMTTDAQPDLQTNETVMQPWTRAAKMRDLNYNEMRKRLRFDDGRVGEGTKPGVLHRDPMAGVLNTDATLLDAMIIDAATFDKQNLLSNAPTSSHLLGVPDHRQPVAVAQFSMLKSRVTHQDTSQHASDFLELDHRHTPGGSREAMTGGTGSKHLDPKLTRDIISALITREGVAGVVSKKERDFSLDAHSHRGHDQRDVFDARPMELTAGSEIKDRTRETNSRKSGVTTGDSAGLTALSKTELDAKRKTELADQIERARRRGKLSGVSAAEATALTLTKSAVKIGGNGVEDEAVRLAVKNTIARGVDPMMGKTVGTAREASKTSQIGEKHTANYKSLPVVEIFSTTINKQHDMSLFESLLTGVRRPDHRKHGDLRDTPREDTDRTVNNNQVFVGGGKKARAPRDGNDRRSNEQIIINLGDEKEGVTGKLTSEKRAMIRSRRSRAMESASRSKVGDNGIGDSIIA